MQILWKWITCYIISSTWRNTNSRERRREKERGRDLRKPVVVPTAVISTGVILVSPSVGDGVGNVQGSGGVGNVQGKAWVNLINYNKRN